MNAANEGHQHRTTRTTAPDDPPNGDIGGGNIRTKFAPDSPLEETVPSEPSLKSNSLLAAKIQALLLIQASGAD
jgi:hypothetical protein